MAKAKTGNTDFKKRLNAAIDLIVDDLTLQPVRVDRLYTPVWRNRKYQWISPMDSDGLFVKERKVHDGDEPPLNETRLRIGVVVQSEFTTSLTKPNPFGKALVDRLPLGVWVDIGTERVRLDRIYVLFILPTATAATKRRISNTARMNVKNAADAAIEAHSLEVGMGESANKLSEKVAKKIRPWLIGAGRPAGS
jgi:hypothetical protein